MRVERISDDVTLYLADCREILPTLPRPAAVISDPPYGQRQNTNVVGKGGSRRHERGRYGRHLATTWPKEIAGDNEAFDPAALIAAADIVLLWGAHRFHERLPAGTWLVWDKVPTGKLRDQGDAEAAWLLGRQRPMRMFRYLWDGVCIAAGAPEVGRKRLHPTQKPEALMSWCLAQARVPPGGLVLDPYMGAGSTGVAAVRAGHPFIGIEIEPLYFDTACRRLLQAVEGRNAA